jgi:hypothetical protein
MFWGCFSYDKKGPFHIWKIEIKKEKKIVQKELDAINLANKLQTKAA